MTHPHEPSPRVHAVAGQPTLSLLRLSAGQRMAGAAVVVALLWAGVLAVVGGGS